LLDTNVLLLFVFAAFMPDKIESSKRLAKYDRAAGDLLLNYVGRFDKILTTAHVLAETSNLARQNVTGRLWAQMSEKLHPLFCYVNPAMVLRQIDTTQIQLPTFFRLGLTDAAIATTLGPSLLLTDDLDLYLTAVSASGDAVNFTHMREAAGIL
jgi:hypothetical protein